jgi:hypothetical protein
MGRPVVHFEIGCRNLQKTQEFYSQMFDWKMQPMGPAAMIAAETGGIGGHISALGTSRTTIRFFMWKWTMWPLI